MPVFSTKAYKGTRDFFPDENQFVNPQKDTNFFLHRQYIFDTWRKTLLQCGFVEYDCSLIEQAEIYLVKSGEELGGKQLYNFQDKGERHIALRPEMTPSLARMVADKYKQLRFPLRWFAIPNCFRYEQPQKGRLREFWQLNVDIIGVEAGVADLEMLFVMSEIMKAFGASKESFKIKLNHRQVLDKYLELNHFEQNQIAEIYKYLDNLHKLENPIEFENFLRKNCNQNIEGIDNLLGLLDYFYQYFYRQKSNGGQDLFFQLNDEFTEMRILLDRKEFNGINLIFNQTKIELDPTIVRGLAYYTGLVFECFDNHPDFNRALFGGGRYDNLLDLFGKPQTPSIGFGMGDAPMLEFLQNWNLLEGSKNYENWLAQNRMEKVGILPILPQKQEKTLTREEIKKLEEILGKLR